MNDVQFVQSSKCSEGLLGNQLQFAKRKEFWFRSIRFIQIFLEQFSEDHEMLAMVEVIIHVNEASFIRVAVGLDVSQ